MVQALAHFPSQSRNQTLLTSAAYHVSGLFQGTSQVAKHRSRNRSRACFQISSSSGDSVLIASFNATRDLFDTIRSIGLKLFQQKQHEIHVSSTILEKCFIIQWH